MKLIVAIFIPMLLSIPAVSAEPPAVGGAKSAPTMSRSQAEAKLREIDSALDQAFRKDVEKINREGTGLLIDMRMEACASATPACTNIEKWKRSICSSEVPRMELASRLLASVLKFAKTEKQAQTLVASVRGCSAAPTAGQINLEMEMLYDFVSKGWTKAAKSMADEIDGQFKHMPDGEVPALLVRMRLHTDTFVQMRPMPVTVLRQVSVAFAQLLLRASPERLATPEYLDWAVANGQLYQALGEPNLYLKLLARLPLETWRKLGTSFPYLVFQSCGLMRVNGEEERCRQFLEAVEQDAGKNQLIAAFVVLQRVENDIDVGKFVDAGNRLSDLEGRTALGEDLAIWTLGGRVRLALAQGQLDAARDLNAKFVAKLDGRKNKNPLDRLGADFFEVMRLRKEAKYPQALALTDTMSAQLKAIAGNEPIGPTVALDIERLYLAALMDNDTLARATLGALRAAFKTAPFLKLQSDCVEIIGAALDKKPTAPLLDQLRTRVGAADFNFRDIEDVARKVSAKH